MSVNDEIWISWNFTVEYSDKGVIAGKLTRKILN